MKRYVEDREILKRIPAGDTRDRVERFLSKQPLVPDLVSRKVAAEILGCKSPHIARYEKQGRMPEPVTVEGGASGYIREEVIELRAELDREKAERQKKEEESK